MTISNNMSNRVCAKPHRDKAPKEKGRPNSERPFLKISASGLTLTGFETALCFVDHVNAALAAHDPAIPVARLQGAKRIFHLHVSSPLVQREGRLH
jgi:hypothetical protein